MPDPDFSSSADYQRVDACVPAPRDISDNTLYRGDLTKALGANAARAIIMPSTTDLARPVGKKASR
jgi:hypothetical protein